MDDVLWPSNVVVARYANIKPEDITDFHINEIENLTSEQKRRILERFADPEHFKTLQLFDKVERVMNVVLNYGAKFEIRSNCFSQEVADYKYGVLKHGFPYIQDSQINLNVIDPKNTLKKSLPDNTIIFIDDSPYNIHTSTARMNIVPRWPWNKTEKAIQLMSGHDAIFTDPWRMDLLADTIGWLLETYSLG
ncbi:MAG: hypothetical protein Q4E47_00830 [Candidatus Saccharibacteria bacterium]|nr:hypothetical protein [Candidatus Saccharibacteria bacterium]